MEDEEELLLEPEVVELELVELAVETGVELAEELLLVRFELHAVRTKAKQELVKYFFSSYKTSLVKR